MLWCFRTRHRVLRAAGVGAPGAALPCLAHALCLADGEAAAEPELSDAEVEKMQKEERERDFPARWAALPIAIIIILSLFGYLIFKTDACQCGTWCNLGAKEAEA